MYHILITKQIVWDSYLFVSVCSKIILFQESTVRLKSTSAHISSGFFQNGSTTRWQWFNGSPGSAWCRICRSVLRCRLVSSTTVRTGCGRDWLRTSLRWVPCSKSWALLGTSAWASPPPSSQPSCSYPHRWLQKIVNHMMSLVTSLPGCKVNLKIKKENIFFIFWD